MHDQEGDNSISLRMVAQHVGDVQAVPFSQEEVQQCLSLSNRAKVRERTAFHMNSCR